MTAEEAAGIDARAGTHPRRAGDRLPASYINFYIANKTVVMPLYDKRRDAAAAAHAAAPVSRPQGRRASRRARYCSAAAISTASPSKFPGRPTRQSGVKRNFAARARPRKSLFYAPSITNQSSNWKLSAFRSRKFALKAACARALLRCDAGRLPPEQQHQRLRHRLGHLDGRAGRLHQLRRHHRLGDADPQRRCRGDGGGDARNHRLDPDPQHRRIVEFRGDSDGHLRFGDHHLGLHRAPPSPFWWTACPRPRPSLDYTTHLAPTSHHMRSPSTSIPNTSRRSPEPTHRPALPS